MTGRESEAGPKGVQIFVFFDFGGEISIIIERCVFSDLPTIYKKMIITFILCVKSIYAFLHKYFQKKDSLNLTIKKTLYFVDESNIWTMQHQWRAARLYRGRRPFPRVFKK